MSLNIKNDEADRLATEVSRLSGETKTTAVILALRERRERLMAEERDEVDATLAEDLLALAARLRSRTGAATLSTDHLYDPETGLPT
ncbi:type II toxin-antitoxin system VapB family antitoxin [Spiractinospora alimapuensis]|uniref:type II toxin-antitoxin system VapB family antitoxin n=1 Tax=Spiractinospora alimapuensis TaxID=2820884 RepID=UPI001F2D68ED|nr:type II toxin-antitoxin system VapB family antitoxin [Spiractinospora alimapuensis]QVQ52982.1 type II toxin-antitoxin system VapB family antitoxin [Spiractinospora alimapuensis]